MKDTQGVSLVMTNAGTCGGYCSKGFLNYPKRATVCSGTEAVVRRMAGHLEAVQMQKSATEEAMSHRKVIVI